MAALIASFTVAYLLVILYGFYTSTVFTFSMQHKDRKHFYFLKNATLEEIVKSNHKINKIVKIKKY